MRTNTKALNPDATLTPTRDMTSRDGDAAFVDLMTTFAGCSVSANVPSMSAESKPNPLIILRKHIDAALKTRDELTLYSMEWQYYSGAATLLDAAYQDLKSQYVP